MGQSSRGHIPAIWGYVKSSFRDFRSILIKILAALQRRIHESEVCGVLLKTNKICRSYRNPILPIWSPPDGLVESIVEPIWVLGYNVIKTRMITVDDRHENLRDSSSILDRDFLQRAKIFGDVKPLIGRPKYPFCNKKRWNRHKKDVRAAPTA